MKITWSGWAALRHNDSGPFIDISTLSDTRDSAQRIADRRDAQNMRSIRKGHARSFDGIVPIEIRLRRES